MLFGEIKEIKKRQKREMYETLSILNWIDLTMYVVGKRLYDKRSNERSKYLYSYSILITRLESTFLKYWLYKLQYMRFNGWIKDIFWKERFVKVNRGLVCLGELFSEGCIIIDFHLISISFIDDERGWKFADSSETWSKFQHLEKSINSQVKSTQTR
jgi:hypothetical protein